MRLPRALLPVAAALLTLCACKGGGRDCNPLDPLCSTDGGTLPSLSIADASADEDSGDLLFTVTLSAAASSVVTVDFATTNGSATAPEDYQSSNGTVTFTSGTTSQQIPVPLYPDIFDERSNETFTVTLTSPSGATIADGSAVGTVNEDDSCELTGTITTRQTVVDALETTDCAFGTGEYLDMWLLTLTGTTNVVIDQISEDIDSWLIVWNANGTLVEEDDGDGFDRDARISRSLSAGRYVIAVTSYETGEVGDYELSINRVLYGASSGDGVPSVLYTIDATTGAETSIGPIGFDHVSAIDFHPTTDVLYGLAERAAAGDSTKVLITIDPGTGVGTEVGPVGVTSRWKFTGMSFRGDGVLFAYHANSADHTVYTVNVTTGQATLLGSTGLSFNGGNGLSFSSSNTLYHSNSTEVNTIDQTTGLATFVAAWTSPAACLYSRVAGADLLSGGRTVFGILKCDTGTASTEELVRVDYTAGTVLEIGPTGAKMDALAVR